MMVQIVERIVYFYHYPMTVIVQVKYNKTLAFPAITICNQNTFRATAAAENGLYELLEILHDSKHTVNESVLQDFGAANMTLENLYLATKHPKEDLIAMCEWQNYTCGPENFTEVLTDHGVCYTFNNDADTHLWATSSGSDFGIKLTLNVEQYEYMPGPHSSAGVKILLHDKNEFPKVQELGLAIPTGSHTFVGIEMCMVSNLPKPHGKCRSKVSPYYKRYTTDACRMACITELMKEKCGCRDFHLPHIKGNPPVCSLEQHYSCYVKYIGEMKAAVLENCDCPVPCDFLLYDPTISFATTSVHAADDLLATTSTDSLRDKYHHALETTARMDQDLFNKFKALDEDMRQKFTSVCNLLNVKIQSKLRSQKEKLNYIHSEIKRIYSDKSYLMSWQKYNVRKNFVRVKNAMEERTLFAVAHSYQELSFQIEDRIAQLSATDEDGLTYPTDVRTAIYLGLKTLIRGRVDLAERALQNYTQLFKAYENGTPTFSYKYQGELKKDNDFIAPKPLLKFSLIHTPFAKKMCARVGTDINNFKSALMNYSYKADEAYGNNRSNANEIHNINIVFLRAGRNFYYSKSVFYADCVEYPLNVLETRIEDLDRRWRNFNEVFNSLYNTIDTLSSELLTIDSSALRKVQNILDLANNFTQNDTANITKLRIAEEFISDQSLENISDLRNFMSNIRSRGQSIYDVWSSLMAASRHIWEIILQDEDMFEFYNYRNLTEYLQPFLEVSNEVTSNYSLIRDESDFRHLMDNQDSLFLSSFDEILEHLRDYRDTSRLDSKFIRDNFLKLDVFYREKSYEEITQQKAYDLFALLCDIGGSMGLFVGASFLTLYEIVDFGLYHCLIRLFNRRMF